tara:strand:- start:9 stop:176 length:168 start_codon:yes stop_codon:yes gene_type:complete
MFKIKNNQFDVKYYKNKESYNPVNIKNPNITAIPEPTTKVGVKHCLFRSLLVSFL